MKGIKIGYVGGGSMNWAWSVMGDLALEPEISGEVRLYDIDFESAKANETIGSRLNSHPSARSTWTYKACATLEESLRGADFVIISILPGTFDEMESDVHAPEKYGIYQSVGDTTGPAGVVRSMRTVPMMVEIGQAVRDYCPNAWVINYTNPMAVCVNALYQAFPGIKAFGCCHESFHTQKLLAKMLEMELGTEVSKDDIYINFLGVNHFTWATRAEYKSMDLVPLFAKFAQKYAASGLALGEGDDDPNNFFRNMHKVTFDLCKHHKIIPVGGDRHLAEFMPPWYLSKQPDNWGFGLTPVSYRKKSRENALKRRARILSGEEQFTPEKSGEEGTELIKALLGLADLTAAVNLPNKGQIEDIGQGTVVETNALIRRDAVYPVCAGRLPDTVHMMVDKHARQQDMLVRACMQKDIDLAFNVFTNDNLVQLSQADVAELFATMLENTKSYLKGWDINGFRKEYCGGS